MIILDYRSAPTILFQRKTPAKKSPLINSDRVQYWLSVGAQPSDRVAWLFGKVEILPVAPIRNMNQSGVPKELTKKK